MWKNAGWKIFCEQKHNKRFEQIYQQNENYVAVNLFICHDFLETNWETVFIVEMYIIIYVFVQAP